MTPSPFGLSTTTPVRARRAPPRAVEPLDAAQRQLPRWPQRLANSERRVRGDQAVPKPPAEKRIEVEVQPPPSVTLGVLLRRQVLAEPRLVVLVPEVHVVRLAALDHRCHMTFRSE
jgi:hypothetical protein